MVQNPPSYETPLSVPPTMLDLGDSEIAYWRVGRGEPLLLVHGYPLNGKTWRHLVTRLAEHFTCYVVDLPGAGETRWTERTNFNFAGQAATLKAFVDRLGLASYSLMVHDTGGTIARRLATLDTARIRRFVIIGTEIPGHRPPWIEFFQKTANPRRPFVMRTLMRAGWFRRSSAAFGGCFYDRSLIDGEFKTLFVDPVIRSRQRAEGLIRYLIGIDWTMVDGMATEHARITMPTLLIWGEDDPVFPVDEARIIADQLPDCHGFVTIPRAKLFVQEERPEEVLRIALPFLLGADRA